MSVGDDEKPHQPPNGYGLPIEGGVLVLDSHSIPLKSVKSISVGKSQAGNTVVWAAGIVAVLSFLIWLPAPIANPAPGLVGAFFAIVAALRFHTRPAPVWHLYVATGLVPVDVLQSEDESLVRDSKAELERELSRL